jgi:hypothetical protein
MILNERQVKGQTGATFADLYEYMSKVSVERMPFIETQKLTLAGVQFALLPNAIVAGNIAKGITTTRNSGIMAAELAGAVGSAATTNITDPSGNIYNLIEIRKELTHESIMDNGRKVYGLIQCSNGVADGVAIGAVGLENLQVSFVKIQSDGTFALVSVTDTIEFQVNKAFVERNKPRIAMNGGVKDINIVGGSGTLYIRQFAVTAQVAANEIINITTGAGSGTGAATATGDTITSIGTNAGAFNADNKTSVLLNGVKAKKGAGVVWDTAISLHFSIILDIGDTFEIAQWQ